MSTRFGPGSHTRLWEHLNALDDDIQAGVNVESIATLPAASTLTATRVLIGSTGAGGGYPVDGAKALMEISATADLAAQRLQFVDYPRTTWTQRGWLNAGVWQWSGWRPLDPLARAKIVKTSTLSFAATTWTLINGYAASAYASYVGTDLPNGRLTVQQDGIYDVQAHHNWLNFGSSFDRSGALVKGTSAPASDGSNVLAMYQIKADSWLTQPLVALDVPLATGDIVTSWIRSGTSGNFNGSSSIYSLNTYLSMRRAS